jgi:hypothetical protein
MSAAEDLRLLDLDIETLFVVSPDGRLVRQSPPSAMPAPRLFVAGCSGGNRLRAAAGLDAGLVADLEAIVTDAPPWIELAEGPPGLAAMLAHLAQPEPAATHLIYPLPNNHAFVAGAAIVRSGEPEGERLLARLGREGLPPHLVAAGFLSLDDFWEPWCAALKGETIAAMCFAARLGPAGAEAGVYTFEGFRGRGLAAAVTAAWSAHPALAVRTLFYSTSRDNRSSQRVAERLGLRRFGLSLSIA